MSNMQFGADPTNVYHGIPQSRPARAYRDLCSTCSQAKACGNRSTPERPILFCELFEVAVPVVAANPRERPANRQDAAEHKGLCVNCESREDCTMVRPRGGVWHCEEYQ